MSVFNPITASINQSTPNASHPNPLAELLKVALNPTLSAEARLLYVILCLMAWSKGYCWPSRLTQAQGLGRSRRQVRRYHQELEQAELLTIKHLVGQSSWYFPSILSGRTLDTGDTPTRDTGDTLTLKSRTNKEIVKNVQPPPSTQPPQPKNVNALSTLPPKPQTSDHLHLVEEIERITGDSWSRGGFINLVRSTDERVIHSALSITRDKLAQEAGVNAGAYFTATVKGLAGTQPCPSEPRRSTPSPSRSVKSDLFPMAPLAPRAQSAVIKPESFPMTPTVTRTQPVVQAMEEDEPPKPEEVIKGLRFQFGNEGVKGLLWLTQKFVTDIDAQELWNQVKELLPQAREAERVDRFLQAVQVRMQHQVARAG